MGSPVPERPTSRRRPSELPLLLALVVLGCLSGIAYIQPLLPFSGDTWPHIVRTQVVYSELLTGLRVPIWSFYFYCGYPFLQFYGSLYYYVAALAAALAGGSVFTGTKWLLFVCHVASGVAMYLLARRVLKNVGGALVAGLAYMLAFWHLCHVLFLARYPVAFLYLLLPLALLSLESLLSSESVRHALVLALVTAALILTHPGYAFFAVLFLAIWLALRTSRADHQSRNRGRVWRLSAAALVGALLISCAVLLPYIVESPMYRTSAGEAPTPVLLTNLLDGRRPGTDPHHGGYLGLSVVLLSLVGLIATSARSRRGYLGPLLVSVVLVLGLALARGRLGFIDSLPVLSEFAGNRFLSYLVVFLSLLAGFAYVWLESRVGRVLALIACTVMMLGDLLPKAMVTVYRRPAERLGARLEYYRRLGEHPSGGRILDLGDALETPFDYGRVARYPATGFMFADRASPFGFYHQFASPAAVYAYQWVNSLGEELADASDPGLSSAAISALHLLAVDQVVIPVGRGSRASASLLQEDDLEWDSAGLGVQQRPILVGRVANPSQALATNIVKPWVSPGCREVSGFRVPLDWSNLLDSMQVDPATHALRAVWSLDGLRESLPGETPQLTVYGLTQTHQRVELDLEASKDCFVRLPYSYFPTLKLKVDGRDVSPSCGADRFAFVRVGPGRHKLVLMPSLSEIRIISLAVSIASLIGWAIIAFGVLLGRKDARTGSS